MKNKLKSKSHTQIIINTNFRILQSSFFACMTLPFAPKHDFN